MKTNRLQATSTASEPLNELQTNLANLMYERDELVTRNKLYSAYIREKTDHLLQVMGTLPLRPEELDDDTLISLDPIGIVTDSFQQVMEHLQNTNNALASTRDEVQAIFDSAGAGIVVVNDKMELVALNNHSQSLFFLDHPEPTGKNLRELICGHLSEDCILEQILATQRRVEQPDFSHEGRHYHVIGTPLKGVEGNITRMVLLYTDITERKEAAQEIERLAYFDILTGLPNRILLKDRLDQMLSRAERRKELVALLFIDLDRFKEVNDTLGHGSGDMMLQIIAERLTGCLRNCDTVARLGGDEFVVLLDSINDRERIIDVAAKVLDVLAKPVHLDNREVFTGGSIGISLYPFDGDNVDTLFKNADTAMYHAKEQGRNNFQFYCSEMNSSALNVLIMSSNLRHALDRRELFLVYQPQISFLSGGLIGVEALLRWNHPTLGMIPPDHFIPLAEDTGLITSIGAWVLETACQQVVSWMNKGLPAVQVAVNLSAKQFRDPNLIETISASLQRSGLPPHLLELELTESMLIENIITTRSKLQLLKDMGIKLAIDDFGTGYSSLSYLRHFPIDRLKIDKSFIQEITEKSDDSAAIVEAIIALSHSLGLSVIAEGVESQDQVMFLLRRSCNELQGYYFSHPLLPESLEELLIRTNNGEDFCLYHYSDVAV